MNIVVVQPHEMMAQFIAESIDQALADVEAPAIRTFDKASDAERWVASRECAVDLLVTDLTFPDEDGPGIDGEVANLAGIRLLKSLRSSSWNRNARLAVLSHLATPQVAMELYQLNVTDMLPTPISPQLLGAYVKALFQRHPLENPPKTRVQALTTVRAI